ncbi:MAG: AtpZ/AtpI family protein [Patescibacteria group bacterium]
MKEQAWWLPAMLMFTRLSVWIIGPVIVGLFVGKWLDNKYHSEPWLFLLSMGIAFIFSMFGIIKNALAEYKKLEEKESKNQ